MASLSVGGLLPWPRRRGLFFVSYWDDFTIGDQTNMDGQTDTRKSDLNGQSINTPFDHHHHHHHYAIVTICLSISHGSRNACEGQWAVYGWTGRSHKRTHHHHTIVCMYVAISHEMIMHYTYSFAWLLAQYHHHDAHDFFLGRAPHKKIVPIAADETLTPSSSSIFNTWLSVCVSIMSINKGAS